MKYWIIIEIISFLFSNFIFSLHNLNYTEKDQTKDQFLSCWLKISNNIKYVEKISKYLSIRKYS